MMRFFIFTLSAMLSANAAGAGESREEIQAQLDGQCEVARQMKLAPLRKQFVEECVANEELPDRGECERFYSDYGNRTGGRAPLFYDLPECEKAFEYRQSVRQRD